MVIMLYVYLICDIVVSRDTLEYVLSVIQNYNENIKTFYDLVYWYSLEDLVTFALANDVRQIGENFGLDDETILDITTKLSKYIEYDLYSVSIPEYSDELAEFLTNRELWVKGYLKLSVEGENLCIKPYIDEIANEIASEVGIDKDIIFNIIIHIF